MTKTLLAAAVGAATLLGAGAASAGVNVLGVENWNLDGALQYGQSYIQNYDDPLAAGFAYVGDNAYGPAATAYVRSGGHLPGETAPPPVLKAGADPLNPAPSDILYESTEYQTVENGGLASI
ncbi:MAG: hypothetical protein DI570_27240, partial [Phenylobacterium zucineum]